MLNPDLKKDVEIEINKAEPKIKDFLLSDYFRETMDLIFRVNRLTKEQEEAVELETVLFLLKISNYENIEDAIKTECNIENISTAKQVIQDLDSYIFEKTRKFTESSVDALEENKNVVLPVKKETEEVLVTTESKEETINKGFNMLGSNKVIREARDILKDEMPIILNKEAVALTNKVDIPTEPAVPVIKTPEPLGDVYLERVPDAEKVIKKETIITNII